MSKELIISSSPHETRVAILEDGQLCEIYIEREKEYALVGSIYKGRVTRVLPGMQSAFVDIGLDTDAFLYVSDVIEDLDEYEHVSGPVENQVRAPAPVPAAAPPLAEQPAPPPAEEAQPAPPPAAPPQRSEWRGRSDERHGGRFDRRGGGRFGRRGRRGRGGRDLPPSKYVSQRPSEPEPPRDENYVPIILPGESLAKYKDRPAAPVTAAPAVTESPETFAPPTAEEEAAAASFAEAPAAEPEREERIEQTEEREEPRWSAPRFEPERESEPFVPEAKVAEPEVEAAAPAVEAEPAASVASANESEEFSFEEAATIAETLAEERQAETLEQENGEEENGESAAEAVEEEHHEEERAEEHEREEAQEEEQPLSGAATEEDEGPQPGNEITNVRMDRPSLSRFERPAARERHRGGRRHRHGRGRERDRDRDHGRERPHQHHAAPKRIQQISDLLKAGQEVIIQITKEPLGKKGARITSHVALPGRFLVYMPTLDHIGISRKIGTAEARGRLRHLVDELRQGHPGGFIARTAAGSATEDDIRADAEYLTRTWQEIRAKSEQRRAPTLLHRDLNLVERLLRDCLNREFNAVWVDSEEEYARVVDFVSRFQPDLVSRVKLYSKETPIFEEMGVQQEIDKSLRPKVWLKSGGYIVINHTEALVAIDVNTGKYVGRGSNRLEDTIVKTNIDAVKEIVRQIRLRDLGGIIVVDFIDMEERRNREKVLQALSDALRQDRAPSKVLPFNEFGLVAITRKRTKQALERVLCQPCPYCSGSGMVKSVPTICYEIEAEARKMAGELDTPSITLRVHPEIAKALKTREAHLIEELERATHKNAVIQSDATLHFEQYDIY
ncbi:MAG: Rne/Rng family ribonuclease [Acidobacteriota bacterium]|nr:Rne/Rng family ribonuclease [Acidobacteriota bacterium]